VKSWLWLGVPWSIATLAPSLSSERNNALNPPMPKASVEWAIAQFLLAERLDAVGGDHAARVGIVSAGSGSARDCHLRELGIGAAEANGFCPSSEYRAPSHGSASSGSAEERDNVGLRGELGEGEHHAWIGRLIVLVISATCLPSTPPRLVDPINAIFAPVSEYLPLSAAGPVTGSTHANLDSVAVGPRDAGERGRRKTSREPHVYEPSVELHSFLPLT